MKPLSNLLKFLFFILGALSLGLGIAGIILPGLPATPFFLLSAFLFIRSSKGLYEWLLRSRIAGPYIRNFRNGISMKVRLLSVLLMWSMIIVSLIFFLDGILWTVSLLLLGIAGTLVKIILPGSRKSKGGE